MQSRLSTLALVALVGCNQAFGLEPTQSVDARLFDAPPPMCPALGTPPAFNDDLQQVPLQNCTDYTVSTTGRALAYCSGGVREGMVDQQLAPTVGFEPPGGTYYVHPRLGPNGDVAIITAVTKVGVARTYLITFTRGDSSWLKTGEIDVPGISSSSAPSRNDRMLVTATGVLHELIGNGVGAWSDLKTHGYAELGIVSLSEGVALSPDGLRALFIGGTATTMGSALLYTDRPTIDDLFAPAVAIPGIEYFPNGFLTEDCSRLYTSALGTVFYVTPRP